MVAIIRLGVVLRKALKKALREALREALALITRTLLLKHLNILVVSYIDYNKLTTFIRSFKAYLFVAVIIL